MGQVGRNKKKIRRRKKDKAGRSEDVKL